MEYRNFGNLGFEVSTFGLGCMRLPICKQEDGSSKINEKEAIQMIRYGIDQGVNYIDTAYPYHGGESEVIVGKALQDGYREKVKLATKLPVWHVECYEDFDKYLTEQLDKLQVSSVDFYLMHALNEERWEKLKKLNFQKFIEEAKAAGKIKYVAFSFHDELKIFKKIIDEYDGWEMCQIQLNILDENYQAGVEGMKYAAQKGIPVVIMEPLKGGKLAQDVPADIREKWNQSQIKRNPAEWAFRWLYNFPEVAVILSGVSNMEQLKDNLRIFDEAQTDCMSEEELKMVQEVKRLYESKIKVDCTKCQYCVPCPGKVAIPRIFELYNDSAMYETVKEYTHHYKNLEKESHDASACLECGACEKACPQNIPIIDKLKEAREALA